MKLIESLLTKNPCYTCGRTITVKGLMLHSVGCPQPSAEAFVESWNSASYDRACVHAFIDANTGVIHQTLPWNRRGWHGGGASNNTHIGVEMCEPSTIRYTGGANWIETGDGSNTKACVLRTYKAAVELFATLCEQYGLDPTADGVIISHREGSARGIASNHADPEHLWTKFGLTMDKFRADVKAAVEATTAPQTPAQQPVAVTTLYYVQSGAFSVKANAEAQAAKIKAAGFDAFVTTNGGTVAGPAATPEISKGDVVQFAGGPHYSNANATSSAGTPKAGPAKVTQIAKGAKHPYHIIHTTDASAVYGWVDADKITKN